MILEVLRLVTEGLSNISYGVNVQIAAGTFSDGDTGPAPVLTIVDETRNAQLAQGQMPRPTTVPYPAVFIVLDSDPDLVPEVENDSRDGHIETRIVVAIQDPDTEKATSNTYYTLNAITQALTQFLSNAHATDRIKNKVQILSATQMIQVRQLQNPEDGLITGSLKVTFLVRNIAP